MAKDFQKKQLTKNEKLIHELFTRQMDMDRALWSTSTFVTALAYLQGAKPEEIAKLLTADQEKVREFSKKVNEEIGKIEKERKDSETSEALVETTPESKE